MTDVEPEFRLRDGHDGTHVGDTAVTVRPSAVMYQVGGRSYPMKSAVLCKTCQSHYRLEIESQIIKGYGYSGIVRNLPDSCELNERNIREHVRNGHMPLDETIRHKIIEDRAKENGKLLEEEAGTVVDHIGFARVGIQKCFEDIMQGKQNVSVAEANQMANILLKAEQYAQGTDVDNYMVMQGFTTMLDILRTMLPADQYQDFGNRLAATPFLKSLMSQSPSVIDVEEQELMP